MTAAVTELQRKKNKKLKFGVDGGGIGGLVLLGGVVAAGALATIFTNHMMRKHGKPINRATTQLDDRKEEQLNCKATAKKEDVQGLRSLLAPSQDHNHNCTVSSEETSKIIYTLTDNNESEEPFSGEQTEICELVIASDNSKTVEFPNVDNYEAAISEVSAVDAGNLISSLVDPENIGNSHGGPSVAVEERSLAEFSEERIEGPSVIENKVDDDKLVEDFVAETEAEKNGNGGSIIAEESASEKIEEEEEKELGRCGSDSSSGNSVSNNGTEEDSSVESNNEAVWPVDSIDGYYFSELTSQIKEDKPQILIQVEEHEEKEDESIQKGFGDEKIGDEKIVHNEFVGEKKSEYNNVGDEGIDGYCCSELTTQVEEAKPQILIQDGGLEEKELSIQVGYGDEEPGDKKIVHREFIWEKKSENSDMGDEGIDGYFCSELTYQVEETKPQILIQVEELEEKEQSIQMSYGDEETGKEKTVQMEFVGEKSENSDVGDEEIDEYRCSKLTPPVEETKPGILIREEGLEEKEEESMQAGYEDEEDGKVKIVQMEFIGEKIENSDVGEEIDGYCRTMLISQVEEVNPHMLIEEGLEEKEEQSIRIGYGDEETGNEKLVQMEFVENRKNSNVVDEEIDGFCCTELLSQVEEAKPQILIEEVLEEKEEQSVQLGCGVEETGNGKIVQMELVEEKNESGDVVEEEIDHHKELGDVVETGEYLEFQSSVEEKKQGEIQYEAAEEEEEEEETNGRSAAMGMGGEMMKMKNKKFTMMGDSSLDARLLVISILVGLLTLFLSHHIFRSYLHATTDG